MSFSQMAEILKQKHKGEILFIKLGVFYVATAQDAVFLNGLLNLKCTCYKNRICKVGVPVGSLQKYINKLDTWNYAYAVYSINKEKNELILEKQKEGKSHRRSKRK